MNGVHSNFGTIIHQFLKGSLTLSYTAFCFKYSSAGSVWVVQLVKHPTLDFGLGHDLMVVRLSPALGSALSMEPA